MHCQILKRGKRILPALKQFDVARAASWCQSKFAAARRRELSDVTDTSVDQVCRPAREIGHNRDEIAAALRSSALCDE